MANRKETDYLIIGAGAMGLAFADVIFHKTNAKITIVDRRGKPGGHWVNAYPFVTLHQPAAFYGVNSLKLGNNTADLSSKPELLEYFEKVMTKLIDSGRVEFLGHHNYIGNGKVVDLDKPEKVVTFQINKKLVDATYMNVEVPSTHTPNYQVDEGVPLVPINALPEVYQKWDNFYIVGCGKTGMDAILYLLEKGISTEQIYWIAPNEAWLFNRAHLQVKQATEMVLRHSKALIKASEVEDIFIENENNGNIFRLDKSNFPRKWRCATVSPEEFEQLIKIENVIRKGRISRITDSEILLQKGKESYSGKSIFVDCSANGLSKRKKTPIFSEDKITLQSVFFLSASF